MAEYDRQSVSWRLYWVLMLLDDGRWRTPCAILNPVNFVVPQRR